MAGKLDLYSIGNGPREQTVLTPQVIVDGLLCLWGAIGYDPCWAPGALTNPEHKTSTRGLRDPWRDRTYCNPPYGRCYVDPEGDAELIVVEEIERRRAKAEGRAVKTPKGGWALRANLSNWLDKQLAWNVESVMLVPNRTHRKWLREWKCALDAFVELDPLKFHGFASAFPAPLVLGYLGTNPRRFGACFAHLGGVTINESKNKC